MTALSSPPISPESPLTSALQARTVRPSRADPAPSFEQVLSDKTDPATQQAADEARSQPNPHDRGSGTDRNLGHRQRRSPGTDPESDTDKQADPETQTHPHDWRAARTDIRAVSFELTNAASVDLAALAAKELSGRKQPAKSDAVVPTLRGPNAAGLSKPRPDDPTTTPNAGLPNTQTRSLHAPSSDPTDLAQPRVERPAPASTDPATRPTLDHPDTAQVSAAVAQQKTTEPKPQADIIAASRQSLLERLSGSAEARRGAVSQRRPPRRRSPVTHADPHRQTRPRRRRTPDRPA
jgi:hypothetical protein